MELMVSTTILALAGAILILQIVVLALIAKTRKEILASSPLASKGVDFRPPENRPTDRRPSDGRPSHQPSREEGRPSSRSSTPPASRPAPVPAPLPAASVDRSLRDINLRLKSAEQDQERDRKRLRDSGPERVRESRDGRGPQGGRDMDRNRGRDRGRNDQRGGRRDGRPGGPGGQSRSYESSSSQVSSSPSVTSAITSDMSASVPIAPSTAVYNEPVAEIEIKNVAPVAVASVAPEAPAHGTESQAPESASAEIQHSRRVVRNRPLDAGGSETAGSTSEPEAATAQPVSFGRR